MINCMDIKFIHLIMLYIRRVNRQVGFVNVKETDNKIIEVRFY